MALQQIYSNNLDFSQPNLTDRFTDAIAFFINTPLSDFELEIDCFLQVYFKTESGEISRNLPLGKIEEQAILLNKIDTETLFFIPQEFVNSNLEMALLFLASDTTFLEVFVVKKEINLQQELDKINQKLNSILTNCNQPVADNSLSKQQAFFFIS